MDTAEDGAGAGREGVASTGGMNSGADGHMGKRRAELDKQQVVLGRRLVAGVDWVGELLEGMVEC